MNNSGLVKISENLNGIRKQIDMTTPVQVVNKDYSIEGNGSRKTVILDNGWIVIATLKSASPDIVSFYVNRNDDNGFVPLCFVQGSGSGVIRIKNTLAIASVGSIVYVSGGNSLGDMYFGQFDATNVTNTDQANHFKVVHGNYALNGAAIAINENGGKNKIVQAWSSRTTPYSKSNNILARQGVISNNIVIWGPVVHVTKTNVGGQNNWEPTITYNNLDNPVLIYVQSEVGTINGISRYVWNGSGWGVMERIFSDSGFGHFHRAPSSTFIPPEIAKKLNPTYINGLMITAWHGRDSVDTTHDNVRCKASFDNGDTWFDYGLIDEKITQGNELTQKSVSVSWNNDGDIFLVWFGRRDNQSLYPNIRMIQRDKLTGYEDIEEMFVSNENGLYYPNTVNNYHEFEKPLTVFKEHLKDIKFYGKWSVGEQGGTYTYEGLVPNTTYKAILSAKNTLNNVTTKEKSFTTLAETSVISNVSTTSDTLTFRIADNNSYRTGYKVYVNDQYVNMFGELVSKILNGTE